MCAAWPAVYYAVFNSLFPDNDEHPRLDIRDEVKRYRRMRRQRESPHLPPSATEIHKKLHEFTIVGEPRSTLPTRPNVTHTAQSTDARPIFLMLTIPNFRVYILLRKIMPSISRALFLISNYKFVPHGESLYIIKVLVHFKILKKSIFFCIFQLLRPLKIFS